jgi:cobalt/nickel transport system permease protein
MIKNGLSVRDKLIIALINILFIVSVGRGNYLLLGVFAILSLLVAAIFMPDYRRLAKRVALVFLYPLFISIFIPFAHEGKVLAVIDLRLFAITITDIGLTTFYTVLIKSFLSILIVSSLVLSVDEKELFYGLRKIKVPSIIVSIIFLMYRYIFLIREESRTGQMAINSRIFRKSHYTVNKKLVFLMGNMLIKSFDRAENIYRSMESRGFTGEFHIYKRQAPATGTGIAILFLFIIIPASLKVLELVRII